MTDTMKDREAAFIEATHDLLMAAKKPEERAYFRIVKELNPPLMRMFAEAGGSEDPKLEAAALLWAFGQFSGANIVGTAMLLAGDDIEKATKLATSISEMIHQDVTARMAELAVEAEAKAKPS